MMLVDPATNQPLPADAIQRVLYTTPRAHIYSIPPLQSTKGHIASQWTNNPPIFTARVRVLETAVPALVTSSKPAEETVHVVILLEDPTADELFAAAPYTAASVVEQAIDSSRFFAVRVVGEGGRKATLGLGFEDRSAAFDFGVALQDAGKVLGFVNKAGNLSSQPGRGGRAVAQPQAVRSEKRDYSLKEGQVMTVHLGSQHGRRINEENLSNTAESLFPAKPAGSFATAAWLPPPPSANDVKQKMLDDEVQNDTTLATAGKTAEELGFDDGEFGEFQ